VTLAAPAFASSPSGTTWTITTDNGGSILRDGEATPVCYSRVNPSYSPKEWGAYEDGSHYDTAALQSWLNAPQPHIGVPGVSIITSPLYCTSASAVMSGPPMQGNTEVNDVPPLFQIVADDGNGGFDTAVAPATNPAMYQMIAPGCAIHNVGLFADGSGKFDVVDAYSEADIVYDSYLSGGANGSSPSGNTHGVVFNCLQGAGEDVQVYDNFITAPYGDAVDGACPNFRVNRNVISGLNNSSGASGAITSTTTARTWPARWCWQSRIRLASPRRATSSNLLRFSGMVARIGACAGKRRMPG